MSLIAKDLPALIFMLLPGFIAAGVFFTLTAHPRSTEFERLVQSLVFTSITRAIVLSLRFALRHAADHDWGTVGRWDSDVEFVWSIVVAILVGLIFAAFANNDAFHALMRRLRLTARTSHPSEWHGAFAPGNRYVVLHLDGERRLRGWPTEWPDQSDKGHFVMDHPEWILDDNQVAPLFGVARLMIPATEVRMVEFLKTADEITQTADEIGRVAKLLIDVQSEAKGEKDGSESPPATP